MDKQNSRFGRMQMSIDAHLSDETLLLSMDGELSLRHANDARLHLEACWTCRTRLEQINDSIAGVVEYSNFIIREEFPPSENGHAKFCEALHRRVEKGPNPSIWNRITGMLRFLKSAPQRPAWIAAVALICIAVLFVSMLRSNTVVSADELVRKSAESERVLLGSLPRPVIYQKFRIEESGPASQDKPGQMLARTIDRSIYSDPVGHELVEGRDNSGKYAEYGSADRLKGDFDDAQLDWRNPLSIESFMTWESLHGARAVQVERGDSGLISIRSTVPDGPVAELLFTMRTSDFHPVAANIFFRNLNRIRVTESFFEVFSLNVIGPDVFALSHAPQPGSEPKSRALLVSRVRVPTENELLDAEMRVRVAIHTVNADLGDQIEIQRGEFNSILVRGVLPSEVKKEEIESELRGIDDVKTRFTIPGDALGINPAAEEFPGEALVVEDQPQLQSLLIAEFPDVNARKAYVDSTLDSAQSALAHAWALKRLMGRYTPRAISQLDSPSRQMLELLVRDHVKAIDSDVETASKLLQVVLPALDFESGGTANCSGNDWRSSTLAAFTCLEKIQDDTSILLAGSQNSQDSGLILPEVEQTIQTLRKQLPNINNQVGGNFLASNGPIKE